MKTFSSMRSSLSGQVASAQPSVRYGPRRSKMSAEKDEGDDIAAGGLSGRQFTGEMYSCSSDPALIR